MPYNVAIILAGGKGERLGFSIPKQFLKFAGKTCLEHSVHAFYECPEISQIVLVVCAEYIEQTQKLFASYGNKPILIIKGGQTRNQSTFCALQALAPQIEPNARVLVHDSVRPLLSSNVLLQALCALENYDAIDTAVLAIDTILEAKNGIISHIPKRENLYYGQTPQGFRFAQLYAAYHQAYKENPKLDTFSDDCGLLLAYCPQAQIGVVKGEYDNHKLTHVQDLAYIEHLFYLKTSNVTQTIACLKDKVIIVLGGTSGIGASIVQIATQYGAKAFALSRRMGVDICNYAALESAFCDIADKNGRIDAIMNLAGILYKQPLVQTENAQIEELVATNYTGNLYVAKAAYPHLLRSHGMLILTSSSSFSKGREGYCIYSSLKASIINLTQALSDEWSAENIAVNCVIPGRTRTPMRIANFGNESSILLQPEFVAKKYLQTMLANNTGMIVHVSPNHVFSPCGEQAE